MFRKRPTLIALSLLITTSIADLWVTLHFNPNLSREANPLVAKLGFHALGLITANLVLISLLCFTLRLYFLGPRGISPTPITDPWGYAGMVLYNKPTTKSEFYRAMYFCWPLPASWHQFARFMGFLLSWGLIAARLAAVFSWFAIMKWHWSSYIHLRKLTVIRGYPCLELSLGLIVAVFMVRYFVLSEFNIEKQNQDFRHSS